MTKSTVPQLPAKLYELLSPLSPEERTRVIQATLILFGEDMPVTTPSGSAVIPSVRASGGTSTDAGTFLDNKLPKNKGETLAVAARYREIFQKEENHSKADLKKVITDARRNFDDNNFLRDINNARRQSGFFNLGTARDASKLSYYGQQFVDALPDREAVAKLNKPKVGGNRKKTTQKKGAKKKI